MYKCRCGKVFHPKLYGKGALMCKSCVSNRRRFAKKLQCIEYLGGKCMQCGYNKCPEALEFDHIEPDKKEFNISGMHCLSWKKLETELKKCQILCSNCHKEKHYALRVNRITDEESLPEITKEKRNCKTCGTEFESYIRYHQQYCSYRCGQRRPKIEWPALNELIDRIKKSNFVIVATELGVTGNSVRKHLKIAGVNPKSVRNVKDNGYQWNRYHAGKV